MTWFCRLGAGHSAAMSTWPFSSPCYKHTLTGTERHKRGHAVVDKIQWVKCQCLHVSKLSRLPSWTAEDTATSGEGLV